MKHSTQLKNYTQGHLREMIKLRRSEGNTYRQIKNQLGIGSTRTIHKRVNSIDTDSKSSAPHSRECKYTFHELYTLYAIRKYNNASIDECLDQLDEQDITIPRSTVGYYLKQRGLTKKDKRITKKFKSYEPGYLHIDLTYGPKINGVKYYIYVAIDRATRLIYVEVHTNKKALTAKGFLERAISFFPFKISTILTDRGKEFTLMNHKGKHDLIGDFDKVCIQEGIEHRLTKPAHPRTNGMVEKANDTIKRGTLGIYQYNKAEEMRQDIYRFMIKYNLSRRHGGVMREKKGRTPFDALEWYIENNGLNLTETLEDFTTKMQSLS